jgi:hypothetical protein
MEDYLYQKDLFLPLGGITQNPMTIKDEEWEFLDRKALRTIPCLMRSLKNKFQRYEKIKMYNNRSNKCLKLLQVL